MKRNMNVQVLQSSDVADLWWDGPIESIILDGPERVTMNDWERVNIDRIMNWRRNTTLWEYK